MIEEGDIALFRFPQTNLGSGKYRPALLIKKVPNQFSDWWVCMVSTQIRQQVEELEWVLSEDDEDFPKSGLKKKSLIRASRLAVVDERILEGVMGSLGEANLRRTKNLIAKWLEA